MPGRVLSTIVHFTLFFTATAGLVVSLAVLADDRPWIVDLDGTLAHLGLDVSLHGQLEGLPKSQKEETFESWIASLGNGESNSKLLQLLVLLYRSWAWSICVASFMILSVSFLAPKNRALVLTVQVLCCLSILSIERYSFQFHSKSRHRASIVLLLFLNAFALGAGILDNIFRKKKPSGKE
mmetsp:Transcript_18366/g.50636  ORF Transcript_18366/g.50636 Transcript_18366/m.50636 type:complete len:181 (-) Transcript_18366:567-1109(-)